MDLQVQTADGRPQQDRLQKTGKISVGTTGQNGRGTPGGTGFTQVPEIFAIFPQIVENVFAENCVAVVFLVSIILNLVLPKNMEAAGN